MDYQTLQEYSQGWIFRHRELVLSEECLADIKPLSTRFANQYWRQNISAEATHASHFLGDDWPAHNGIWLEKGEWQAAWESDDMALPELLQAFSDWNDNTVVYFCYDINNVVQTTWRTFKQSWKNFLFYDDEPIMLAKKRMQVARFHSNGTYETGIR
ncbi:DUF2947 domain-containing protein [Thalassolituus oleivorans]|uniref:DUF2947 domain-containing protein n=1 Tax=Thalassolituus oleivorans TaxID=187493 RepID=UPI001CE3B5AC|nr:DUF2947 domain-containing protein [Thalassolituus oleivorans]MCA6127141.1 hypothetical protein [Thalassolituus oleivorans 4BN06-13]